MIEFLIRRGSIDVDTAAPFPAKHDGAFVVLATRKADRSEHSETCCMDEVAIDYRTIDDTIRRASGRFTKVLNLAGFDTLAESLEALEQHDTLYNSSMAGGS